MQGIESCRKVSVTGASRSGKTSLVKVLVGDYESRSIGVNVHEWRFDASLMSVWDFVGGEAVTARLASAFTTFATLNIVCIDSEALLKAAEDGSLSAFVDESIYPWLPVKVHHWLPIKEFALVLTKTDLVNQSALSEVQKEVANRLPALPFIWLAVSCENEAADAKEQIENLVLTRVPSDRGISLRHCNEKLEMEEISLARSRATVISLDTLLDSLRERYPKRPDSSLRSRLFVCHCMGYIIWSEFDFDPLTNFVILDPMVVVAVARALTSANSETIVHTDLTAMFPSLGQVEIDVIKQFMIKKRIVYAAGSDAAWDSELLVPTYWSRHSSWQTVLKLGTQFTSEATVSKHVRWQYHFIGTIPRNFFEKLLVESYSPLRGRNITKNGIIFETDDDFICRFVINNQNTAHLTACAYTDNAPSWWVFQYVAKAIERVLAKSTTQVSRCVLNDKSKPMSLSTAITHWKKASPSFRSRIPWLPPDLAWFDEGVFQERKPSPIAAPPPRQGARKWFGSLFGEA